MCRPVELLFFLVFTNMVHKVRQIARNENRTKSANYKRKNSSEGNVR